MARIARALTLGEFATTIAHEITQPIAALTTNIETALRFLNTDGGSPEKVKAALERALRDADRTHQVVQQTRSFVTRDDGNPEPCVLNDLVKVVANYVSSDLVQAAVAVQCELTPGLPPIFGRPIQLQQVLMNLIINAKEAMLSVIDRPRRLTIRTGRSEAGDILVTVADNGDGMSQEASARAFEHFYTTKHGGMGLGLALSRTLIEAHGGRLWCDALTPHGTCFSFTLPVGDKMGSGHGG